MYDKIISNLGIGIITLVICLLLLFGYSMYAIVDVDIAVKNNYECYLDGQMVNVENINMYSYNIHIDHDNEKIILSTKRPQNHVYIYTPIIH